MRTAQFSWRTKFLAVFMSIVLAIGLCPIAPTPAYADEPTKVSTLAALKTALEKNTDTQYYTTQQIEITSTITDTSTTSITAYATKRIAVGAYGIIAPNTSITATSGADMSMTNLGTVSLNSLGSTVAIPGLMSAGTITIDAGTALNSGNYGTWTLKSGFTGSGTVVATGKWTVPAGLGSGTAVISGGLWSVEVPTKDLKSGYVCVANTDTATMKSYPYKVVSEADAGVASITKNGTTTTYATIAAAIEAASSGDTITLLSDISDAVSIEKSGITIALNGHKLTDTTGGVQVKGSATDTKFTGTGTIASLITYSSSSTTVDGPTVVQSSATGDFTMNSGEITDTSLGLTITGNGTITGGTISVLKTGESSNISISGGTITAQQFNGGTISITGGTFGFDPSSYVAKGYTATNNNDGTWTVTEKQIKKAVGVYNANGTVSEYDTLAEALNAATDGATIELQEDITETSRTAATLSAKNITLDLNGQTVTKQGAYTITGSLTVKDSSTDSKGAINMSANARTFEVKDGGALTIESGNYSNNVRVASVSGANSALTITGGNLSCSATGRVTLDSAAETVAPVVSAQSGAKLTISGGSVKSTGNEGSAVALDGEGTTAAISDNAQLEATFSALCMMGSSSATVSGGTISTTKSGQIAVDCAENSSLTVTGGNFKTPAGSSQDLRVSGSATIAASGGKFVHRVDDKYLTDTSSCIDNTDDDKATYPYKVTFDNAKAPVKVTDANGNDTYYTTLDEALKNAGEGATVTLQKDVTLDAAATISSGITLDTNGKNITGELVVKASTTIKGKGTIKKLTTSKVTNVDCVVEISDVEIIGNGKDAAATEGEALNIGDGTTVNVNSGWIKHASNNKGGTFNVKGGTLNSYNRVSDSTTNFTGGTYNFDPTNTTAFSGCIPFGYAATDNGDGTWSIGKATELTVSTAEQFKQAMEDPDITKVTLASSIPGNSLSLTSVEVTVKGTKTLDLNGKGLSVSADKIKRTLKVGDDNEPATLTVTGTGYIAGYNGDTVSVSAGSTLNLESGNITYFDSNDDTNYSAVVNNGGTVNIKGGAVSIDVNGGTKGAITNTSGTLNVSGGIVTSAWGNNRCITTGSDDAVVNISGGNLSSHDGKAEIQADAGTPKVTVTGGQFAHNFAAINASDTSTNQKSWLAEGATVTDLGSGETYRYQVSVTPAATVVINGKSTEYSSLKDALNAASAAGSGAVVQLQRDASLGESATISGNVTLDMNGHAITKGEGANIAIAEGKTLTVKGNNAPDTVASDAENDGVKKTTDADGDTVYTVIDKSTAKASVTTGEGESAVTYYYESLAEAIQNAPAGATIALEADASLDTALTIDKNLTLDLKGQKLTTTKTAPLSDGVNFTVTDTSEGAVGTYTCTGKDTPAFEVPTGATLNVNAGTISSAGNTINATGGTVDVTGGTVQTTWNYSAAAANNQDLRGAINASNGAQVSVSGGTISGGPADGKSISSKCACGIMADGSATKVEVSGNATVQSTAYYSRGISATNGANVDITGGTVQTVNDGLDDDYVSGTAHNYRNFAVYGDTGGQIKVTGGTLKSTNGSALYITDTGTKAIFEEGTTVQTVVGTSLRPENNAYLEINGGTFNKTGKGGGSSSAYNIKSERGDIKITGGTFNLNAYSSGGSNIFFRGEKGKEADTTLEITGGTFTVAQSTSGGITAYNVYNNYATATISGGSFGKNKSSNTYWDSPNIYGEGATISGGKYSLNKSTDLLAEGSLYKANTDDDKGTYPYVVGLKNSDDKPFVVTTSGSGETAYATFAEALEAVGEGSTIKLNESVTLDSSVTIDKGITIDLNGNTIAYKGSNAEGDAAFKATGTAGKLTVTDTSTAKSGSIEAEGAAAVAAAEGGTVTVEAGIINGSVAKDDASTVVANGGTFKDDPTAYLPADGTKVASKVSVEVPTGDVDESGNPATTTETFYTVIDKASVQAEVTDTDGSKNHYATLAQAVVSAQEGSTIALTKDVQVAESLTIGEGITLDLDGKSLTTTGDATVAVAKLAVGEDASATIASGISVEKLNAGSNAAVTVAAGATVDKITLENGATATVASGAEAGKVVASGSKYGIGTSTASDGVTYTVVEKSKAAASVTTGSGTSAQTYYYATLADAIANAPEGATVKLANNVTTDVTISVDKSLTIDLNGKKIASADDSVAPLTVTGSGVLTVTGKGGSVSEIDVAAGAKASIDSAATVSKVVLGEGAEAEVADSATVGTVDSSDTLCAVEITAGDGSTTYKAVKAEAVAAVTVDGATTNYASLQAALDAAAKNGGAVALLADVKLDIAATVSGNLTLDMNGHALTAADGGAALALDTDVALTVKGTAPKVAASDASSNGIQKTADAAGNAVFTAIAKKDADATVTDGDGNTYYYKDLKDAVDNATGEAAITLEADTTIDSQLVIGTGKNITLDLNGKTLTAGADAQEGGQAPVLVDGGSLVVKDSTASDPSVSGTNVSGYTGGKITGAEGGSAAALIEVTSGTATVESGMVDAAGAGNAVAGIKVTGEGSKAVVTGGYVKAADNAVSVDTGAAVEVKGGVFEATNGTAIAGSAENDKGNTIITISGGNLVASNSTSGEIACGVYHPQSGTLSITGGTIAVDNGVGVLVSGGAANIEGGTVNASGTTAGTVGTSTGIKPAAVVVDCTAGTQSAPTVRANISGGTFTADSAVGALDGKQDEGGTATDLINVSGGSFSSPVEQDYCAEGYEPTTHADGTYGVKIDTSVVATIVDASGNVATYKTLQAALDAAKSGDTVKLQQSVELDAAATVMGGNSGVTIDLNGYDVTGKDGGVALSVGANTAELGATLNITGEGTVSKIGVAKSCTVNVAAETTVDTISLAEGAKAVAAVGGKVSAKNIAAADDAKVSATTSDNTITFTAISAESAVASITDGNGNTIYFDSLQDAIDNAGQGGTVKVEKDIDLDATVSVAKDITIDLNGNTVTGADGQPAISVDSANTNLKITDSSEGDTLGSIIGGAGSTDANGNGTDGAAGIVIARDATGSIVTIKDGVTVAGGAGGNASGTNGNGGNGGAGITDNSGSGTVDVEDGATVAGGNGGTSNGTGNGGNGGAGVEGAGTVTTGGSGSSAGTISGGNGGAANGTGNGGNGGNGVTGTDKGSINGGSDSGSSISGGQGGTSANGTDGAQGSATTEPKEVEEGAGSQIILTPAGDSSTGGDNDAFGLKPVTDASGNVTGYTKEYNKESTDFGVDTSKVSIVVPEPDGQGNNSTTVSGDELNFTYTWYKAKEDADGNPEKDSDGNIVYEEVTDVPDGKTPTDMGEYKVAVTATTQDGSYFITEEIPNIKIQDTLPPNGKITLQGDDSMTWDTLDGDNTFSAQYDEPQTVEIASTDVGSGLDTIKYFVYDKGTIDGMDMLDEDTLKSLGSDKWTTGWNKDSLANRAKSVMRAFGLVRTANADTETQADEPQGSCTVEIQQGQVCTVYALFTDIKGNRTYISSAGLVLYVPVEVTIEDLLPDGESSLSYDPSTSGDLTIGITKEALGDTTVDNITIGGTTLVEGTDYTVTDEGITISDSFLSTLPDGDQDIKISYDYKGVAIDETTDIPLTVADSQPDAAVVVTDADGNKSYYDTLADALENATAGSTVKLKDDVALVEGVTIDKDITLDLNGKTITSTGDGATITVGDGVKAAIKGGAIDDATGSDGSSLAIGAGATVTLGNGENGSDTPATTVGKVVNDGTLNVTKGATTGDITGSADSETNVAGGNADSIATDGKANVTDGNVGDIAVSGNDGNANISGGTVGSVDTGEGASTTITGGTIEGSVTGDGSTTVTGGEFTTTDPSGFMGEDSDSGVKKTTDGDGNTIYTIIKKADADASVTDGDGNTYYYEDLADAIANAPEGSTVTLSDDVATDKTISVDKGLTIDLNGHNLTTAGDAANAAALEVGEGKTVTVTDDADKPGMVSDILVDEGATLNVSDKATVAKVDLGDGATATTDEGAAAVLVVPTSDDHKVVRSTNDGTTTYKSVANEDIVASVTDSDGNTSYYESLQDALDNAKSGDTVTLTDDVTLDETATIKSDITLDLDGNTITAGSNATPAIKVDNNKKVTIGDGTIDGTVGIGTGATVDFDNVAFTQDPTDSLGEDSGMVVGKYTDDKGNTTYKVISRDDAAASITDGGKTYYYDSLADAIENAAEGSTVTLANDVTVDSTVPVNKNLTIDLDGKNLNGKDESVAPIEVATGKTLTVTDDADQPGTVSDIKVDENGNVAVNDKAGASKIELGKDATATVADTANVDDKNVAATDDGYTVMPSTNNGATTYKSAPEDQVVATVTDADGNTKGYASLQDALDAAEDGDTVTLKKDVTVDDTVDLTKDITLDLNGKTIKSDPAGSVDPIIKVTDEAKATITGGTVDGNIAVDKGAITEVKGGKTGNITTDGTLNVSGGKTGDISAGEGSATNVSGGETGNITTEGSVEVTGGKTGGVTTEGNGSAAIKGGEVDSFTNNGSGDAAITDGKVGEVTTGKGSETSIEGGSVDKVTGEDGSKTSITGGTVDDIDAQKGSEVDVNGGTVTGTVTGEGNVSIDGGTFTTDPSDSLDSDKVVGKYTDDAGNTTYKVIDKNDAAASITDGNGKTFYYDSLDDAIDNAADGSTVTVTKDITSDSTIDVDKNLTIDLGGNTIKSNGADPLIKIGEGKNVTIKNGTVDGTIEVGKGASLTLDKATTGNIKVDENGNLTVNEGSKTGVVTWSDGNGGSTTTKTTTTTTTKTKVNKTAKTGDETGYALAGASVLALAAVGSIVMARRRQRANR